MAKKKEVKNIEVLADVQLLNEIQEAIEEVEVETPEVETLEVETPEVEAEAPVEVVEVVEEVVKPSVEEVFGDKDLVTFVNNKGELRIGQYGYISKRGYKAIEKYKSQK
jgi:hypothetical protein